MQHKRIVIISATSLIAIHCARRWMRNKSMTCILVGRSAQRIEPIAVDLRLRSPQSTIHVMEADFLSSESIELTVERIISDGPVDTVLIAQGSLPIQQDCENDLALCQRTLLINGLSPVLFAEAFARHMEKANQGTLILMGSVAGDRGRKSNYVYGAAKGLVDRYAQGLQHRFAKSKVNIVLIKPGPTNTPMTAHLHAQGMKLAQVEDVARTIVLSIQQGKTIIYAPRIWRVIMHMIRIIPRSIFNRLPL